MTILKTLALTALGILLLVVIAQNTAPVETTLLFVSITMPRAVLLLLMLLVGFALGIVTALVLVDRGRAPTVTAERDGPAKQLP